MANGRRRNKTPVESLVTGLAMGAAMLAWWAIAPGARDSWWLLPCALFMGLMPAARGVSGILAERSALARERASRRLSDGDGEGRDGRRSHASVERTIIRLASESGGRLTPALVVLGSEMTIEEAERALDGLAKKGYAAMRVNDDGHVEYEFAEFLSRPVAAN
jgi:hypothetical protein